MAPFSVFLLLLFAAAAASDDNASPTIFHSVCGANQTQDPEGFDVHFVDAMEKVFQNITKSGFASSVSGSSNLTVFGLGQCFSYLSSVNCQLCYAQSRVKLPHCLPATAGRIYLDGCFLEYSHLNVSLDSVDASDAFNCGNSTFSAPAAANLTAGLVGNLTSVAYRRKNYYEVGSSEVSPKLRVYAMAQCWQSLNSTGCRDCLEKGRKSLVGRCLPVSSADAMAMNAGCFVRYSTEPFYLPAVSGGSGGSSHIWIWVIVALSAVVAVLGLIAIAIFGRNWRKSDSDDDGTGEIIRSISKSHLSFKYENLIQATDNFNQNNKLGQGGYGSVYKGTLPDGKEVAVKRLFFNTRQWIDQFFNEVTIINQVQHKNLVKLLGCSIEGPESLLVYEFLSNTSLDHYLFDPVKKGALDWERRFEIVVGTAEGLAYLHNASVVRIIHRDIKASNVLLDDRFRPKISDFGLARYFADDQSHLSTGLAGTFGYMAPEYIVHGQLTEKADIYSYGVLVLEIITGRKNQNSISAQRDRLSGIQFIYEKKGEKTIGLISRRHGGTQGNFEMITLRNPLTWVSGHYVNYCIDPELFFELFLDGEDDPSNYYKVIISLKFGNQEETYGPFGAEKGQPFFYRGGTEIVGFHGFSSDATTDSRFGYISAIGLYITIGAVGVVGEPSTIKDCSQDAIESENQPRLISGK